MLEVNISARQVKAFRSNLSALKQTVNRTLIDSLSFIFGNNSKLANLTDYYVFIEVMLVDDNLMGKYNLKFRNINKSTNVLSLQYYTVAELQNLSNSMPIDLGMIIISLNTCLKESELSQIDFTDHLKRLCVHGLLHLLGYDHLNNVDASAMQQQEDALLNHLGINIKTITSNYWGDYDGT
jgi:probable rRNA maturation factor